MATALYDYEEAVRDGVLCDFRKNISGARTHFQIEGVKTPDLPLGEINRLSGEGIDPYDINFEGTELEKKVAVKGTSEAIVREFMENCLEPIRKVKSKPQRYVLKIAPCLRGLFGNMSLIFRIGSK